MCDVISSCIVNTNRKRKTATLWKADLMLQRRPAMSTWCWAAARVQRGCWAVTANIKAPSPGRSDRTTASLFVYHQKQGSCAIKSPLVSIFPLKLKIIQNMIFIHIEIHDTWFVPSASSPLRNFLKQGRKFQKRVDFQQQHGKKQLSLTQRQRQQQHKFA